MAVGPGKYDDELSAVVEAIHATGAILIVIGGDRGEGFSCQATLDVTMVLPRILRNIADTIEADLKQGKL